MSKFWRKIDEYSMTILALLVTGFVFYTFYIAAYDAMNPKDHRMYFKFKNMEGNTVIVKCDYEDWFACLNLYNCENGKRYNCVLNAEVIK